jgi:hypothetical protein
MFTFDNLGAKGFCACFAAVELDGFKLFPAPAALNHFPALAIGTTISTGVSRLVAVLPKQVEVAVWFNFFEGGFCWHKIPPVLG